MGWVPGPGPVESCAAVCLALRRELLVSGLVAGGEAGRTVAGGRLKLVSISNIILI